MAAKEKFDIGAQDPDEVFLGDGEYDRYPGKDLSQDPMLADEKRTRGRKARRQERERERLAAEREAIRAELLAEMEAENNGGVPPGQAGVPDEPEGKRGNRVGAFVMSFLSGNILSRQEVRRVYPYLLFIAFLAFIYIGNVFRMQHLHRKHERLTTEVKELRAKSMTIASEKMRATRQSNIIREIERRGLPLRESLAPNKTIHR
ncbi:MAG: hypothetical protein LUF87_10235 [Alistipes sp.]|nr:hypothetical protein [Alistipes sp.]